MKYIILFLFSMNIYAAKVGSCYQGVYDKMVTFLNIYQYGEDSFVVSYDKMFKTFKYLDTRQLTKYYKEEPCPEFRRIVPDYLEKRLVETNMYNRFIKILDDKRKKEWYEM